MKFQMSQPIESTFTFIPRREPNEPTEKYGCTIPRKTYAHEMHEKAGSISNTCARAPLWDDMKKRLFTKPGSEQTAPVCSVRLSGCTSS